MRVLRYADRVEFSEQDKGWVIQYTDIYGNLSATSQKFESKDEAIGFLKGWNYHRKETSEAFLISYFGNKEVY